MSTSARAQELAEQLLGLEATRTPLPSGRHFGAGGVGEFVRANKKAVTIAAVGLGAIALFYGYKKWEAKKQQASQ